MKTVFSNSELVHTFAQRTQSNGTQSTYTNLETLECNEYEFDEQGNII